MRIQSMNGVNLDQFAFEFDLTWMSFFQNAAGETYARYGGRDDAGPETYLNRESLVATMRSVLELHAKEAVQRGGRYEPIATSVKTPSSVPTMKAMIEKRKESCIHCHDVKVAQLRHKHQAGTLRKEMVFTYPDPRQLGLAIDPRKQSRVLNVDPDSAAANAGLLPGDKLVESDGHRLLTYADLTRVLELAPAEGTLSIVSERNGQLRTSQLELSNGWRISRDPSWRASLHTVGPGAGFWGRPANSKERKELGLESQELALKVTFVWAPHAKSADVRVGDVIVELDGKRNNMTMRQCHAQLHLNRQWGDEIKLLALRRGKQIELEMRLPAEPPLE